MTPDLAPLAAIPTTLKRPGKPGRQKRYAYAILESPYPPTDTLNTWGLHGWHVVALLDRGRFLMEREG